MTVNPYFVAIGGGAVAGLIGGAVAEHMLGKPSAEEHKLFKSWSDTTTIPADVRATIHGPNTTMPRNLLAGLGVAVAVAGGLGTFLISKKFPTNPSNLAMLAGAALMTVSAVGVGATAGALGGYALLGPKD